MLTRGKLKMLRVIFQYLLFIISPLVVYDESKCKSVICQKYPKIKKENNYKKLKI